MVFGEEFVPAIVPAIILCLSELVNAGLGMVAMLLTMSGREAIVIRYTFFALIVQIMLAIPLGALLGATGVAFALVVSALYLNVMYHSKVRATLGADISILGKT
jgi:O-antigen/teichoic acid export membrane protein